MNRDGVEKLRKKLEIQQNDRNLVKTSAQIPNEIHHLKVSDSKQILSLRKILFSFIVTIVIIHLIILYYFLDKTGEINISHQYHFYQIVF